MHGPAPIQYAPLREHITGFLPALAPSIPPLTHQSQAQALARPPHLGSAWGKQDQQALYAAAQRPPRAVPGVQRIRPLRAQACVSWQHLCSRGVVPPHWPLSCSACCVPLLMCEVISCWATRGLGGKAGQQVGTRGGQAGHALAEDVVDQF